MRLLWISRGTVHFTLGLNPAPELVGSRLHEKHIFRKHGEDAYYGQAKDEQ